MKRKIIATTFTALSLLVFAGCSSKEVTIENKQPVKYEVLGMQKSETLEHSFQKYLNSVYTFI